MNVLSLLLADPSPCLRRLVLRDLFQRPPDDEELAEIEELLPGDPLLGELLALQEPSGAWTAGVMAAVRSGKGPVLSTAFALARLGYLGLDAGHLAVQRGAEFLFARQQADGSWPLHAELMEDEEGGGRETYTMMPLQTALPLRGLAACGYATDPRAERAYEWLIAQRLPEGAWPTGLAAGGVQGYVAGYRRLAHSRWGCRSNTTGALVCLAHHPHRRTGVEMRRGLDLLLGRETRERQYLGFETARLVGAEPARGFITTFARFDLAQVLDLCGRAGLGLADARVRDLAGFVRAQAGPYGLWEYAARPQVSRWVTLDVLRSLERLEQGGDWQGEEPRTAFRPYLKREKRF